MIQDGRHDENALDDLLPRGEAWSPPVRAVAGPGRSRSGTALVVGLALAAAVGAAVLLARRADGGRVVARVARAPTRHVRREAKVRGFWAGVLASAGSAVAGTIARRLAEDLFETARNERAAEKVAQG